ncbi:MAG: hypothetical protein MUC87_00750 [Bacteroidia bacterium]|nr:hypothetical protein [Bacteroidia bacterium]
MDNNFETRYKSFTTEKLLNIVRNPGDYQPQAVDAARKELESRQVKEYDTLSESQTTRATEIHEKQQAAPETSPVNAFVASLVEIINPVQRKPATIDLTIKRISLFLGVLFIYDVYKESGFLKFMFTDQTAEWDLPTVLYFLPLITLSIAALLFWRRKKAGWMLSAIYFSYTVAGAIQMCLIALNSTPSGIPALDELFPPVSPVVYIVSMLFFGWLTWILCKPRLRAAYQIDNKTMFIVLALGAGINFLTGILITMF